MFWGGFRLVEIIVFPRISQMRIAAIIVGGETMREDDSKATTSKHRSAPQVL